MKEKIECYCDVDVEGNKKYKPFVEEVVNEFMDYMETYYKLGFVKSIKLNVYFKEKNVKNE